MNNLPPDPYEVLHVSRDADISTIKTSYRKRVLQCHPDKVADPALKAVREMEFQLVQQAYDILNDVEKRRDYDLRSSSLSTSLRTPPPLKKNSEPKAGKPSRDKSIDAATEYMNQSRRNLHNMKLVSPYKDRQGAARPSHSSTQGPSRPGSAEGRDPSSKPQQHMRASSADGISNPRSSNGGFGKWFRRNSSSGDHPGVVSPTSPDAQSQNSSNRRNYFRRSSTPPRPRQNASRASSRGSQASVGSVGSQVSWDEMDEFDRVLEELGNLVTQHIKQRQRAFSLGKSRKGLQRLYIQELSTFQTKISENIGIDHGRILDPECAARYRSLVNLYDEVKVELMKLGNRDLSKEGNDDSYYELFCEEMAAYAERVASYTSYRALESEVDVRTPSDRIS